jgi:hypothetical protein
MTRTSLLVAAGIAAAVAVGALIVPQTPAPPAPAPPEPALPLLAATLREADRIELMHDGKVLWLERRGQIWGLANEGGYPVRPEAAAALIDSLVSLRLLRPAQGSLASLGVADPAVPGHGGGTLVRVLSVSGATLAAIIAGQPQPAEFTARRPSDSQSWVASGPIPAPIDPAQWSDRHLPPLTGVSIEPGSGLDDAAVLGALAAGLPFTAVRPAPQLHLPATTMIRLMLPTGSAVLTSGRIDQQAWLRVTGTAPWAAQLLPWVFAVPNTSPLAPPAVPQ